MSVNLNVPGLGKARRGKGPKGKRELRRTRLERENERRVRIESRPPPTSAV